MTNIVQSFNDNTRMRIHTKSSPAVTPISAWGKTQQLDSPFHCFLSNNSEMKRLIKKRLTHASDRVC